MQLLYLKQLSETPRFLENLKQPLTGFILVFQFISNVIFTLIGI